ncbi:MAG: DNA polymerase/3'-5' exonuclease PolX [Phycisphaerae bacterium]|nr:DNA polymerase/3'-5' exonuclease PolX [Phycisphaerae bacterium]
MGNKELAAAFERIADLLDIQGEQSFRVNAYRRASRALKDLPQDAADLLASGALAEVPGIGKGTLEKVEQFVKTGKIALLEDLRAAIPGGLPELLDIPGMGPKKVALVWKELGVDGIDALRRVIDSGELAKLKGLGEKSVAQIKAGLEFAERSAGRTALGVALPIATALVEQVRRIRGVCRADLAGSLRRGTETIGDVDILCESASGPKVVEAFVSLSATKRVLASGETKGSVLVEKPDGGELQVDLRVVPAESYGAAYMYFTGSKEHNVRLRELAIRRKWKLNEWGLFDAAGKRLAGADEIDVYKRLGLPFIPPELREDRGEVSATDGLPKLIERDDIRGDLHMHTTASDGTVSAEQMAEAAGRLGYEYIAITDHSRSSTIANGLSIDRMWRQIDRLRELNKKLRHVTVLVGCECDILADGTLDYPDSILAACDLVVASLHSSLRQDRVAITRRLLAAIDNPYVTIVGHPTGRLINKREPADLDMEAVVAAAARTGTALEINAAWQRLDLHDRHVRMARDAGVMLAIDTDSHAPPQLEQMELGVRTARRGWVRAEDVLNTRPLPAVRKWIARKRAKAR